MSSFRLDIWKNLKVNPTARENVLPHYRQLSTLWEVLPEARLVGGVVRDILAQKIVHDIDLAIPLLPDDVQKRLEKAGMAVIPTGLKHGTVIALIDKIPFEITTLRKDIQTDGRHAQVDWTDDWREDALRRDFTINAMFLDQEGHLYDYFGGQQDLYAKRVRFVGDAERRIEEDSLRILRFFRFHARYGGADIDPSALEAIIRQKNKVRMLSPERVWSELKRIFEGPQLSLIIHLMEQTGVLTCLFPQGFDLNAVDSLLSLAVPVHPLLFLYVLAKAEPDDLAHMLRLSGKEKKILQALKETPPYIIQPSMSESELQQVLYSKSAESVLLQSYIVQMHQHMKGVQHSSESWSQLRGRIRNTPMPVFPLAGKDLLGINITPGKGLGHLLKQAEKWWLQAGCIPDKEACLAYIKKTLL